MKKNGRYRENDSQTETDMTSIKEIANCCGVSAATVSKALNDRSDIGAETKQRIQEAAQQLGYVPDASARTLRTRRSYTIGVLFGNAEGNALTDEFFPHVLNAFKCAAERRGYEIAFINKTVGSRKMTFLEHCNYRKVDGVVMAYVRYDDPEVIEMLQSRLPIVTVDYAFEGKTSVCFDNVQGMQDLVTHICNLGHRRIAYICGENSRITKDRLAGFYRVAEEFGITIPDCYVKEGGYLDYRKAIQLTEELLDLPKPPTCILYPNDFSAVGGIGAIHARGLSIPKDISVAGYDGIPVSKAMTPGLTTLEQDSQKMGETIAEKLSELIEESYKVPIERLWIRGKVCAGGTVKKLRK